MKRPHFALPEIYDDSLSYYEVLKKLIKSMHAIVDNLNKIPEQIANEAKARELADGTLQINIDNEATARQEADNALRELISTSGSGVTEAQLNEEVTARQQADTVLDGKISELKGDLGELVTIEKSDNMFDKSAIISDYYFDRNNGFEKTYGSARWCEYIPIEKSGTYCTITLPSTYGSTGAKTFALFDKDKILVAYVVGVYVESGVTNRTKTAHVLITISDSHISTGVKYIGVNSMNSVSYPSAHAEQYMFVEGEIYPTEYIAYVYNKMLNGVLIEASDIKGLDTYVSEKVSNITDSIDTVDDKVNEIRSIIGINDDGKGELINLPKDNQGYVMSSGRLVEDSTNPFCYTNLVEVVPSETYEFVSRIFGNLGVAYYDSYEKYISGVSGTEISGSSSQIQGSITFRLTIPVNAKYIRVSHDYTNSADKFTMQQITGVDTRNEIEKLQDRVTSLEQNEPTQNENVYYAACGDSITHANHDGVADIDASDEYYPIDGYDGTTYARKNYAYYIAKRNGLKWANYGWGGTTLHSCYPKAYGGTDAPTHPFVDGRIEQLKSGIDWDYISIFFGYNDSVYGPAYQRDLWLTEEYGTELGYPINDSQIGTTGFANAEQKSVCDAVRGSVGGVDYDTNDKYFYAKFVGTKDDTVKTTYCGALNYTIDYLFKHYKNAKIMVVVPYVGGTDDTRTILRTNMIATCEKWGVPYFDFAELPYWFYKVGTVRVPFENPDREDGRWYCENGTASFAGTIEGFNHARFTRDGTHPNNLGYKTISHPIGDALLNR